MFRTLKEKLPETLMGVVLDLLKRFLLYAIPAIGLLLVNQIPTIRDWLGQDVELTLFSLLLLLLGLAAFGSVFTFLLQRKRIQKLELDATTDVVTGVFNDKILQPRLEEAIKRANNNKEPLSVILIDVDGFKNFNDKYGHTAADFVLKEFAQTLKADIRGASDVLLRYKHGDEFMVIAPKTDGVRGRVFAERLRNTVKDHQFEVEETHKSVTLTLSAGIAELIRGKDTIQTLLRRAEEALNKAKKRKNTSVLLRGGASGKER